MLVTVADQFPRFRERDNRDLDPAPSERIVRSAQLAEVRLARQSSEVAQENQQNALLEQRQQLGALPVQVEQPQRRPIDSFHQGECRDYNRAKKRGRPDLAPPCSVILD